MDVSNPYADARELEDLYGRFEHALKRNNHLKKGRPDAQADWDSFARKLGEEFFKEVESSGIATTLINDPPRKLMAEGPSWKPEHPPRLTSTVAVLVQGVCRVRHSYVHYEKFVSDGAQWERDAALVHEALEVLRLVESKRLIELPKAR